MLMNDGMQASSLLIILYGDLFEICADVSILSVLSLTMYLVI